MAAGCDVWSMSVSDEAMQESSRISCNEAEKSSEGLLKSVEGVICGLDCSLIVAVVVG